MGGHGKGIGYKLGQSYQNTKANHMWNAVLLEDQWYLLDACWGAGKVDMDKKAFIKRYQIHNHVQLYHVSIYTTRPKVCEHLAISDC